MPIRVASNFSSLAVKNNKPKFGYLFFLKKETEKSLHSFTLFIFQDDNFVLSAIFCAIEENNLEGLDKLLSMANIDVNQVRVHHIFSRILIFFFFFLRKKLSIR